MQLHNSADNFRIKIKKWGMIFLVAEVSEAIVNQVHKISEMSQKCSNHSGVRKQWQAKIGHLAIAPSPCRVQKKKTKTKKSCGLIFIYSIKMYSVHMKELVTATLAKRKRTKASIMVFSSISKRSEHLR